MNIIVLIFPVLGALCLYHFLRIRVERANVYSLVFKALTSVCFMGVVFCGLIGKMTGGNTGFALMITAGLFFGLLGDIWLDLKYNCPDQSDPYTYAGFISFAVGHVFFLVGLIGFSRDGAGILWIILPIIVAVAAGIAVGMGGKLMGLDYGKFKGITMFYGALLISSALVSLSICVHGKMKNPAVLAFFIGSILFLISDLILSGTYFGEGKNRPKDIAWNHIFYYAGQFLIAFSAVLE